MKDYNKLQDDVSYQGGCLGCLHLTPNGSPLCPQCDALATRTAEIETPNEEPFTLRLALQLREREKPMNAVRSCGDYAKASVTLPVRLTRAAMRMETNAAPLS